MKPSASALADAGSAYLGRPYAETDCQAFVERCLKDIGIRLNLPGSNAWYRRMTWTGTPEECRARFGRVPAGAILFILKDDGGEPAKYRADEADFLNRVRLLSTTHFGLATPVLNIQRETAANALAARLTEAALQTEGPLVIRNVTGAPLQCVQLQRGANRPFSVQAEGLRAYTVLPMGDDSVFLMLRFDEAKDAYAIATAEGPALAEAAPFTALESGGARLEFDGTGRVRRFTYKGLAVGGGDFLRSYLTYGGKQYDFTPEKQESGLLTGGRYIRVSGKIVLPSAEQQGAYVFTFFTSDAAEGIFALTDVSYPYTAERDAISTENSTLGRYTDMKWQEAAPFCLSFANSGPVSVVKRNFEGDISSFRTASFAEADPANRTLDSFNNQLTAGLVGLTDGGKGLLLGVARNVLCSMACCPMRLSDGGRVTMNPFGTFAGRQRHHPNRSGDRIPKTYTLIAPQGKSLAPSYNGSRERALLCLLPFAGDRPEEDRLASLLAFADGAYVTGADGILSPFAGDNVWLRGAEKQDGTVKVRSPLLGGVKGNLGRYVVRGAGAVAYILKKQRQARD